MVRYLIPAAICISFLFPSSLHGQETDFGEAPATDVMPLLSFVSEYGLDFQWDPFGRSGIIENDDVMVSFYPGAPWIVVNYARIEPITPILLDKGTLYITVDAVKQISAYMVEKPESTYHIAAVVIDPGHGGKDPGANHVHVINDNRVAVVEKEINLTVSLALYDMLKKRYPEKKIILTRNTDVYPTLEERTEIANAVAKDLEQNESMIFISVHANASLNPKAKGFEVWYLPPDFPTRQNLVDPSLLDIEEGQEDILPILNTMKEEEFTVESILLAKDILSNLELCTDSPNRGLIEESWFVVRNARMAAVLIELGYITNPEEAVMLSSEDYLMRLSTGIYNGACHFIDYFERTSGFTE